MLFQDYTPFCNTSALITGSDFFAPWCRGEKQLKIQGVMRGGVLPFLPGVFRWLSRLQPVGVGGDGDELPPPDPSRDNEPVENTALFGVGRAPGCPCTVHLTPFFLLHWPLFSEKGSMKAVSSHRHSKGSGGGRNRLGIRRAELGLGVPRGDINFSGVTMTTNVAAPSDRVRACGFCRESCRAWARAGSGL